MRDNLAKITHPSVASLAIARELAEACEEAKGKDLLVLDVEPSRGIADYFIVVSGRSDRQAQGIANRVLERLAKMGIKSPRLEGFDEGQWILVDTGDVIVHIFYEPVREHYDVESLWASAKKLDIKKIALPPKKAAKFTPKTKRPVKRATTLPRT